MTPSTSLFDPVRISRLGSLELVARVVVEGFLRGVHRSRFRGSSAEFAENRPYAPGDEITRLDWKAWAKTDRLWSREFEDETNARVTLLVDGSASMGFGTTGLTKFRYASCLAACVGQLLLQQIDAIGLALFAGAVERVVPARTSRRQFRALLAELDGSSPGGSSDFRLALEHAAEATPRRGLVFVFSDLLAEPRELLRGLGKFRAASSEVTVFHLIDPAERDFPFTRWTVFRDPEQPATRLRSDPRWLRATYLENFARHLDQLRTGCRSLHIDYQPVDPRTPLDAVLSRFLTSRRKHGVR